MCFKNIIFISGVDGVGKSSTINHLSSVLDNKKIDHKVTWIRFINYLSKFILFLTRLTGHNKKKIIMGNKIGFHYFYSSNIISFVFLTLQFVDQLINILINFYFLKKRFVISDRGIPDTVVDWIIDTHKVKVAIIMGTLLVKLLPNAKYILLVRDVEEIIKNRPDVLSDENFYLRERLYRKISKIFFSKIIFNHSIKHSVKEIMKDINHENY